MWNKLLPFVLASLLTACGGVGENYYRLSATAPAARGASASGLNVAIGPVRVPSYIDRAEIVFASGPNEFQIPTNALWIGSLQENIARTVASDLGQILGSGNVRAGLESGAKARYRVALDLRQFHGISGQEAILELSWRIQDGTRGELLSRHSASFREPIIGDGYDPLVAAESRLLAQAATAIAASLRR